MLATFFFSFDYSDLAVIIPRVLHISAGAVALFAGLIPMLGRKGGLIHRRAGRVYVGAMITVALTAVALTSLLPLTGSRLFLTGVAFLSFYLSFSGWRTARRRTSGLPTPDRVLAIVTMLVGLAMVGLGIYWQAILFAFFGGLTLTFAGYDVRAAFAPPAGRPEPWMFRHISRMGGSYIATFTAFLVVNMSHFLPSSAPEWVNTAGWIAPSVVGGFLIRRTLQHYRAKGTGGRAGATTQ